MILRPISTHIVNGATLMGFGIAVILLSLQVIQTNKKIGIWSLSGGIFFLLMGVYEILVSLKTGGFFEG